MFLIISGFPWANLPPESVIVDVGGGMGTSMIALYSRFQDLNCIIQEVPSVCALGENVRDSVPTGGIFNSPIAIAGAVPTGRD